MNIAILERKFALRSKYVISAPEQNYYAERKFFSFLANLQLFGQERQVLARIPPGIELSLAKETSTTFASTEMPTESW